VLCQDQEITMDLTFRANSDHEFTRCGFGTHLFFSVHRGGGVHFGAKFSMSTVEEYCFKTVIPKARPLQFFCMVHVIGVLFQEKQDKSIL